jgi:Spy/CpxP family protein refolding chaperone
MGMGPGRGPGGPGGLGLLRGIELTDAQREQIRTIHEQMRDEGRPAQMAELQKQLHLAILADSADTAKIEQLKQSIAAAEAAALAHRIEVQTRVAQVLTPEQRASARQNLEKNDGPRGRPGRGGGFGGPGRQ